MPTRYIRFVLIALLQWIPFCLSAQDSTQQRTITKANYQTAKLELEKMLDGKQALSYERAIYLIENAWWDNRIDPIKFQAMLDWGINNIRQIMAHSKFEPKPRVQEWGHTTVWDKLDEKYKKDKGYSKSLTANYAIYKYMTDTTLFMEQDHIFFHEPYYYSTSDPMGSNDWTNTQVVSLMQKHMGNCYAFVSLFKIFAERLHTDAVICSAPSHVYICHSDEDATLYNIELSSRAFPSTGTISTLTHTTQTAAENDISLRQLDLKQSVALCLVYLAKGYEHKLDIQADDFILQCAEQALQYDAHNLNALLLKREVLEQRVLSLNKSIAQLKDNQDYKNLEQLTTKLYQLGYKEMPLDMKNLLIQQWSRDSSVILVKQNYSPVAANKSVKNPTRNFNLAWGVFEEEIKDKPMERYGRFLYNTKLHKITAVAPEQKLYNDYSFDPVAFAMNVDPLAHKFPWQSPYSAFNGNPIIYNDPTGAAGHLVIVDNPNGNGGTVFIVATYYTVKNDVAQNGFNAAQVAKINTIEGSLNAQHYQITADINANGKSVKGYNVQFSINVVEVGTKAEAEGKISNSLTQSFKIPLDNAGKNIESIAPNNALVNYSQKEFGAIDGVKKVAKAFHTNTLNVSGITSEDQNNIAKQDGVVLYQSIGGTYESNITHEIFHTWGVNKDNVSPSEQSMGTGYPTPNQSDVNQAVQSIVNDGNVSTGAAAPQKIK
jgi:hypothetical protein